VEQMGKKVIVCRRRHMRTFVLNFICCSHLKQHFSAFLVSWLPNRFSPILWAPSLK